MKRKKKIEKTLGKGHIKIILKQYILMTIVGIFLHLFQTSYLGFQKLCNINLGIGLIYFASWKDIGSITDILV